VAQVVECLCCKCRALTSNSSATQNKTKRVGKLRTEGVAPGVRPWGRSASGAAKQKKEKKGKGNNRRANSLGVMM
jgi:hypothetical protein